MSETIFHFISHYGYWAIFLLLVLGIVGLPVPDEWLLTFAGYLVHEGRLRAVPVVAAAFLGSVCGISLSYALGRTLGFYLIERYGRLVRITPEKVRAVHDWFARLGKWTLTFGYFFPGIRHLTAYVAGATKLELAPFALFAYSGGALWTATFISLGYFVGKDWRQVTELAHRHLSAASLVAVTALAVYWLVRARRGQKPEQKSK